MVHREHQRVRAPVAGSTGWLVPWTWLIRAPGMNVPIECRPRVTTTAGSSTSSWRCRYGAHAAISSGSGSRLSGGRHFTTFVMNTSSRRQPIVAEQLHEQVAGATDERPALAILVLARALTDEHDLRGRVPLPGTAFVRVSWSRQRVQARTSAAIASSAARRSASVTLGPRERRPRRGADAPRAGRGRTQPRSTRTSAISTAFVAAPLRRLSETTQNARPAAVGDRGILADAPDEDLVPAGGLGGQRVLVARRVVLDDDARHGREQLARLVRGDRVARLDVDRLGMAHEDRDADGRARDAQVRQVQDLAALGDDLPLLLRVAVRRGRRRSRAGR